MGNFAHSFGCARTAAAGSESLRAYSSQLHATKGRTNGRPTDRTGPPTCQEGHPTRQGALDSALRLGLPPPSPPSPGTPVPRWHTCGLTDGVQEHINRIKLSKTALAKVDNEPYRAFKIAKVIVMAVEIAAMRVTTDGGLPRVYELRRVAHGSQHLPPSAQGLTTCGQVEVIIYAAYYTRKLWLLLLLVLARHKSRRGGLS